MKKISNILAFFSLALFLLLPSKVFCELSDKGYKELHNLTKVIHYVEESYVEEIDEQKILHGAIKGLLSTLDPHSVYLSPDVYKELKLDTTGRFQGVGIEVGFRDNMLTVVSPIKGSPAEKAGIKSGDKIIAINGKSTNNMDLTEAVSMIRGKNNTNVNLVISREDQKKPIEFKLTRTVIKVPSVSSEIIDDEFGYISISNFQQNTTSSLEKALKKLKDKKNIKGLMLDLRQNPGGLLDQAVSVSDLFLEEGVIVTTKSRGKELERYVAHKDPTDETLPMIVLVDEGTASASEIVAGALQDNNRAVILGTQTFGKGSVQTVIELDDGSALKLTVAKYYTPNQRSIQADGIKPNIIVPKDTPETSSNNTRTIREKDLKGHLVSEVQTEEQSKISDYQKKVALDYLKSWSIFKETETSVKGGK